MRKFLRGSAGVLVFCALLGLSSNAFAQEYQSTQDKMLLKLGRGLANVVTGWMELGNQPQKEYRMNGLGKALTTGLLKGVGYAVARTVGGAYEIVSFPVPMPENYRPVIQPPLLFTEN